MADFPTNLKAFTTHNIGDVINPDFDNEQQAEIEALEAKVGVDGSVVTTSHDYKLGEVTGSDKAVGKSATQTLTNKTLTTPIITSPKITVGSDAVGDLHYKSNVDGTQSRLAIGSASQVLTVSGGIPSWQTPASIIDASTTVKGVVEAATSAEVTAGTATGGTGAVLVVTPDALAASTPVFNGSSLTNLPTNKLTTAIPTVTVGTSSTAENTLLSYSLAGGVLGTANAVLISGYFTTSNMGSTETITVRLKYGATTLFSPTFALSGSVTSYTHKLNWIIVGSGATGTQNSDYQFSHTSTNNPALIGASTSTEDSTASKTIAITAQSNVSDANLTITLRNVTITKVY